MGKYQTFRGNPETKLLYVVDQLMGGINTDFSDDVSPDNEFQSIVNFNLDRRGSLYKRMGFGKMNALSEIFNLFYDLPFTEGKSPEKLQPELTNDNIIYMKLLKDDNNVFRNLSGYSGDKAYRDYQKLYGSQNNEFKLLILTYNKLTNTSTSWLFRCKLPEYNGVTDSIQTELKKETIPLVLKWDYTIKNVDTIEYFDKIYFTSNDKCLLVFDRTSESYSYIGSNVTGKVNQAYKPNAMEVRKIGFNVLGDTPLNWIDYQGLTTNSIQGVYITTTDYKPVQIIPAGGKFKLNVLFTGDNSGFSYSFKEGESVIPFTATEDTTASNSNLKVYNITLTIVPTSEIEIKIEKTGATLDPYYDYYTIDTVPEDVKLVEPLNIGSLSIVEMYNRALYYGKDTIWFSEIDNFGYIPNYNYVTLPLEPTDEITKIIFFRNVYVIFTKNRIYKMLGTFGSSDFSIMPLNLSLGCHAPGTIVPIENVLYFASKRGLYQLISNTGYGSSGDTLENVKEIDTKIKSITSDITLYLGERTDPAYRYNGIVSKASAIRYKDKYMLFYNNYDSNGVNISYKSLDCLVYQYEMKAFTQLKFPIKPTFLFLNEGVIQTFTTVPEKEEYTKEEVLLNYDFENQPIVNNVVTDLSENNKNGTFVGAVKDYVGRGITLQKDSLTYLRSVTIPSNFDVNGMSVIAYASVDNYNEGTLFRFAQSKATTNVVPTEWSVVTPYNNGYRLVVGFYSRQGNTDNQAIVDWNAYLERSGYDIPTSGRATISVVSNDISRIWVENQPFDTGQNLGVLFKQGSFELNYDSDGTYRHSWYAGLSANYQSNSSEWVLGPAINYDVTQGASWDSRYGIRLFGSVTPYNGGATITGKVQIALSSSLYVGERALTLKHATYGVDPNYINTDYTVPAISKGDLSTQYFDVANFSYNKEYRGSPTTNINAVYFLRATIKGVFREYIEIPGIDITMPSVTQNQTTVQVDSQGRTDITLNPMASSSLRQLKASFENNKIRVDIESENGNVIKFVDFKYPTNVQVKYEFQFTQNMLYIKINDSIIMNATIDSNLLVNANRDDIIFFNNMACTIYTITVKNYYTEFFTWNFLEGKDQIILDASGKGNNGTAIGLYSRIIENGLIFNGSDNHIIIPNLEQELAFSNGFKVEFECYIDENNRNFKFFDLAMSHNTGTLGLEKASINMGTRINSNIIDFSTTSLENKTYALSYSDRDMLHNRSKWKIDVEDNGSSYTVSMFKNGEIVDTNDYNYGGISNILRASNFIGKSNIATDDLFKGIFYNFKVTISASDSPVPVYVGAMYEYDTTYDDFGRAMEVELESKGINLQYPLHQKRLKHIFIKGLGGDNYSDFFFELYSDGHLVNDPKIYNASINEITKEVVYEYVEVKNLSFSERISLLGNYRLNKTRLGESTYETIKLIIPTKGKNFNIKLYGESKDYLSIESIGFIFKLGKVKEG